TGAVSLGPNAGATRTVTVNGGTLTVGGAISNGTNGTTPTVAVTKTGNGILVLSGAGSYTGATTVSGGILRLGSAGSGANSPLGTVAAGTTVSSGATLDLNGFTLVTAENLTISGTGAGGIGALANSSSTAVTYAGLL